MHACLPPVSMYGGATAYHGRRNAKRRSLLWATGLTLAMVTAGGGCGDDAIPYGAIAAASSSGLPPIPTGPPSTAEELLNDLIRQQYPSGSAASSSRTVDPSIAISSGADGASTDGSLTRLPVSPDDTIRPGIGFDSPTAPVDAVCVGFGSPDNAWCIPTDDAGALVTGDGARGAAAVPVTVPAELCAQLSQICHDIRCYEFARTSAGTFSADNVNMLAFACGQCDEPSCQSLLDSCGDVGCTSDADCAAGTECVSGQCVGAGVFRVSLLWDSSNDLDLYVTTPTGSEISYTNPTADSGTLDVDDTSGGSGSVENVFFSAPPDGSYTITVDNYSGPSTGYRIEVAKRGAIVTTDSGTVASGEQSAPITVTWP